MVGMLWKRFGNVLMKERYRYTLMNIRCMTSSNSKKKKIDGIPFQFDEEHAREYFEQWLKSLW